MSNKLSFGGFYNGDSIVIGSFPIRFISTVEFEIFDRLWDIKSEVFILRIICK